MNVLLNGTEFDEAAKALDSAAESDTILQLFKESHEEQLVNIRRARNNALCDRFEDMKSYENKAFVALLKKVGEQLVRGRQKGGGDRKPGTDL